MKNQIRILIGSLDQLIGKKTNFEKRIKDTKSELAKLEEQLQKIDRELEDNLEELTFLLTKKD